MTTAVRAGVAGEHAATSERTFFIATSLLSAAVPQHFHALGVELVNRGHPVVILRQASPDNLTTLDQRIQVHTWPSPRPTRFVDALFFLRLLYRYRPHCLLANFGAVNTMCAVGALFGVRHRIAYYHTLMSQIDEDTELSPLMLGYLRLRKRWLYRLATHCISNSQATLRDLTTTFHLAPAKCAVWRLSLEDAFSGNESRNSSRAIEPLLVCAGRLQQSKGLDVLIRALPTLCARFPSLTVEILGEGPMRLQYEALAKELGVERRCHFAGKIEQAQVLKRMSSAWVTVVPSRAEAFGLVNVESMSMGTPVVASRVGGIPDIVRDGVDGFLVPPGDPEALAEKLAILLGDRELREQMGRNARDRFFSTFEQSMVVREQADWLEALG